MFSTVKSCKLLVFRLDEVKVGDEYAQNLEGNL